MASPRVRRRRNRRYRRGGRSDRCRKMSASLSRKRRRRRFPLNDRHDREDKRHQQHGYLPTVVSLWSTATIFGPAGTSFRSGTGRCCATRRRVCRQRPSSSRGGALTCETSFRRPSPRRLMRDWSLWRLCGRRPRCTRRPTCKS